MDLALARASIIACALGFGGCTIGSMTRSAEVARPGDTTGEALMPVKYGRGAVHSTNDNGETVTVRGGTAPLHVDSPGLTYLLIPAFFEFGLRYGAFAPCEIGPTLTVARYGAELRCGLLQQPDGAPLSVALSGAASYGIIVDDPWWFRTGLDVSRRIDAVQLSAGLYASHGTTMHSMTGLPSGFGRDADSAPVATAQLRGWRISMPLGVTVETHKSGGMIVGVVPYVWADQQTQEINCPDCSRMQVDRFEERWGISATFGGYFRFVD